jgi:hypothetical protein
LRYLVEKINSNEDIRACRSTTVLSSVTFTDLQCCRVEYRRKYSEMDKGAKDNLAGSLGENGG